MSIPSVSSNLTLAITIDSQRVVGALVDTHGRLFDVQALPNPLTDSTDELLHTVLTVARQVVSDTPPEDIHGAGVVVNAPVAADSSTIRHSETLISLENVNLASIMTPEIGLPVTVENDINAMALAEAYLGTGQDAGTIFYIYIDTELNGAIVQDGQIWRGMNATAGQIGYLVADWMGTRPVTLGQRASGQGIATEYNIRSRKHRTPKLEEIIQYANQGDHLAIRVIRDGAHVLGSVISPVMDLLDPDLVVAGGRFALSGDLWWSNFVHAFNSSGMVRHNKPPVARAKFDEDAALQGAALIARRAVHSLE